MTWQQHLDLVCDYVSQSRIQSSIRTTVSVRQVHFLHCSTLRFSLCEISHLSTQQGTRISGGDAIIGKTRALPLPFLAEAQPQREQVDSKGTTLVVRPESRRQPLRTRRDASTHMRLTDTGIVDEVSALVWLFCTNHWLRIMICTICYSESPSFPAIAEHDLNRCW